MTAYVRTPKKYLTAFSPRALATARWKSRAAAPRPSLPQELAKAAFPSDSEHPPPCRSRLDQPVVSPLCRGSNSGTNYYIKLGSRGRASIPQHRESLVSCARSGEPCEGEESFSHPVVELRQDCKSSTDAGRADAEPRETTRCGVPVCPEKISQVKSSTLRQSGPTMVLVPTTLLSFPPFGLACLLGSLGCLGSLLV